MRNACSPQYKHFQASDIINDPKWRFPVFVTTTNDLKSAVCLPQTKRWAISTGFPRVLYKIRMTKAKRTDDVTDLLYASSAQTIGVFVQGMPGYLEDANPNPSYGFANGVPGHYHHIVHSSRATPEQIHAFNIAYAEASPLDDVWLEPAPYAIAFKLDPSVVALPLPHNCQLIGPGIVAIPVSDYPKPITIYGHKDNFPFSYKVKIYKIPVTPAFAVTYWKVQGRTVERVILDLTEPPFLLSLTLAMLYVGFSRVAQADHIRVVTLDSNLVHIYTDLKFNKMVLFWLRVFADNNGSWPQDPARYKPLFDTLAQDQQMV